MKKLLLLLSCCLATWCSVQAGAKYSASSSEFYSMFQDASASNLMLSSTASTTSNNLPVQVTSFSYKENEGKIHIKYKTDNVSSVSVNFWSIAKQRIVNTDPISIPLANYSAREEAIPLEKDWPDGMYVLLLYVNGSVKGQIRSGNVEPCNSVDFDIAAKGSIKSFKTDTDAKRFTVNYSLQYGATANSSMRIYDGTTLLHSQTISNPNTSVNTYKDYSFSYSSFADKLVPKNTYTCKLYTKDRPLCEYDFIMPSVPVWRDGIKSLTYEGGRLKINFTVKDLGANVRFRVIRVPLSGSGNSETKYYDYGNCGKHEGTYEVYVPSFTGLVVYAVVIIVNNKDGEGKQIILRR